LYSVVRISLSGYILFVTSSAGLTGLTAQDVGFRKSNLCIYNSTRYSR